MMTKNAIRVILQLFFFIAIVGGAGKLATWMIANKTVVEAEPVVHHAPPVVVLPVRTQSLTLDVRAQGEVRPHSEGSLTAEVTGRVLTVSPALVTGGFFEAGDELVQIERSDYELAKRRAEARLAQTQLLVDQALAEADVAQREWAATGVGDASPLTLHRPQLAGAQAERAAAQADLDQAEMDLRRTTVRAPYAGRVRTESVDPGSFVRRGDALAEIYAVDFVEVRLAIPDRDLRHIDLPLSFSTHSVDLERAPKVRLSAQFAGSFQSWEGRIVRAEGELDARTRMVILVARVRDPYGLRRAAAREPAVDSAPANPSSSSSPSSSANSTRGGGAEAPATGTSTSPIPSPSATASADFAAPRPPLAVGLFVDALIEGRTLDDAILLPRHAMHTRDTVLVVDGDDRLRYRKVEILWSKGDSVVVAGDLQVGTRVCVTVLDAPVEGMTVSVVNNERPLAATRQVDPQVDDGESAQ